MKVVLCPTFFSRYYVEILKEEFPGLEETIEPFEQVLQRIQEPFVYLSGTKLHEKNLLIRARPSFWLQQRWMLHLVEANQWFTKLSSRVA
jgi:hypothetical protein